MTNFFLKVNYVASFCILFNLIFCSSIAKGVALEPISPNRAIALENKVISSSNRQQKVKKPKFPDRGIPTGRRRGGTSRNECQADKNLTAIVPGEEISSNSNLSYTDTDELAAPEGFSESESFLTKTIEKYPSFWVYVPGSTNFANRGEFVLQDESDRDIYRTHLALPDMPGILEIRLPPRAENSLKTNRKYHWYIKAFCGDEGEKSGYVFIDAWIERVAVTTELKSLLNAENANRYKIFRTHDLWHDAIDVLAENRQNSREQYNKWNELLDTLGLADLIDTSIPTTRANFLIK